MFEHAFFRTTIACLAVTTAAFAAEPTSMPPQNMGQHTEHRWNTQSMEDHFAHKMDKLKTLLQLTPNQESAWAMWTAAIKPLAPASSIPDQAALAKMTTPERLDTLHSIRTQRNAELDRHEQATKDFYAVLTQPQRKVFDLESLAMIKHHHHHHAHARWGHQDGANSQHR